MVYVCNLREKVLKILVGFRLQSWRSGRTRNKLRKRISRVVLLTTTTTAMTMLLPDRRCSICSEFSKGRGKNVATPPVATPKLEWTFVSRLSGPIGQLQGSVAQFVCLYHIGVICMSWICRPPPCNNNMYVSYHIYHRRYN